MAIRNIGIATAAAVLLSACGSDTLDWRNAEMSNGKVYAKGENQEFSGELTNFPQSVLRDTPDLTAVLAGLARTLDQLRRPGESIRTIQLVCNGGVEDGFLNGEISCYEPGTSTLRYKAHYKLGSMDGELTIWGRHSNELTKANFKNDRRDGQFQVLSPTTGKVIEQTQFRAGVVDGLQQTWDEHTGQLTYQANAENGVYIGIAQGWAPDGRKIAEVPYQDGRVHGTVRAWDADTGQLVKETSYKNNLPNGPMQEWYEDGTVKSVGEYRDNIFYPAPTAQENGKNDKCVADYADKFHAQAGEDAPVNSEQLEEWEKWCQQGHPSS